MKANNEELPSIGGEDIEEASKVFSTTISGSPDGWHPRHFGLISEAGRRNMAHVMDMMERQGRMPPQTEVLLMVMLSKPQGGVRPICMFPAIYRVWMKIRRPHCDMWETKWHRPFFTMGEGQEPGDTVWRSAVRKRRLHIENKLQPLCCGTW